MLDEFFKVDFLPYVISFYDVTVKVDTTTDDLLRLMVQAIQILQMDKSKVCTINSPFKL
jgi:hypothetical protein